VKSRKESGSSKKEIQSHSILENKERDEKLCDDYDYRSDTAQATCSYSDKKTHQAFNQSAELRSGYPITTQLWKTLKWPIRNNPQVVTETIALPISKSYVSEDNQW